MKKIVLFVALFSIFCSLFVEKRKNLLFRINFLVPSRIEDIFKCDFSKDEFTVLILKKEIPKNYFVISKKLVESFDSVGIDVVVLTEPFYMLGGNILKEMIDNFDFFIPAIDVISGEGFNQKYLIKRIGSDRNAFIFTSLLSGVHNIEGLRMLPLDSMIKVYVPFLHMQTERMILFSDSSVVGDSATYHKISKNFEYVILYPDTTCVLEFYDDGSLLCKKMQKKEHIRQELLQNFLSQWEDVKHKKISIKKIIDFLAQEKVNVFILSPFENECKEYTVEEFLNILKGCPSLGVIEMQKEQLSGLKGLVFLNDVESNTCRVAGFFDTIKKYAQDKKIKIVGIPWDIVLQKE